MSMLQMVSWGDTVKVNLVRSTMAGIVWFVFAFIMAIVDSTNFEMAGAFCMLLMPVVYFCFFLPLGMVSLVIGKIFPIVNIATWIPAIAIVPGDPLVYFLHKAKPHLVPTKDYSFFSLSCWIWVLNEQHIDAVKSNVTNKVKGVVDSAVNPEKPCPFKGRILVDKDTEVLGFTWPSKTTAFYINEDWSVATENDRRYGWVDVEGKIHEGITLAGIDPKAVLAGGETGLKINGSGLWAKNEKVGEMVSW